MTKNINIYQQAEENIACHECDLLVRLKPLLAGQKALCPRCGYTLTCFFENSQDKMLALSITSLIFLLFSIPFSFLSFTAQGKERAVTLFESIEYLTFLDFNSFAVLMTITTLIIPGLFLSSLIYVLLSLKLNLNPPHIKLILKLVFKLSYWNMAEIFLVGILVSFIKIVSIGTIELGVSFWSYTLFIIFLAAALSYLDRYQIWRWVKHNEE